MGTPGRKRNPVRETFAAEDDALSHIAKEAEAKLASKRAARAEAREIRLRELERQQKDLPRHNEEYDNIHQWMDDGVRGGYDDMPFSRRTGKRVCFLSSAETCCLQLSFTYLSLPPNIFTSPILQSLFQLHGPAVYQFYRLNCASSKTMIPPPRYSLNRLLGKVPFSSIYEGRHGTRGGGWPAPRPTDFISQCSNVYTSHQTSSLYSEPLAPARSCRVSVQSLLIIFNPCSENLLLYTLLLCCPFAVSSSSVSSACRGGYQSSDDEVTSVHSRKSTRSARGVTVRAVDIYGCSSRRGSALSDFDDVSIPELAKYTDDHSDNDLAENTGRPLASRSAVSALSSSNLSSKQGNGDIGSLGDVDVSTKDIYELKDQLRDVDSRYTKGLKEIKESLSEVQEKFKKAMVTNAQLDNEKFNLIYQVDTLRDSMEEMEEQMAELRRQHEDKCKDLERQKHAQSVLQYKYDELQEGLKQRDALIEEIKTLQRKEESYVREVNDLQEAIGWKEKKIGALERQKVHFECIMNERDELRQQVTQLKEELKKKHGLVMVPEGEVNGEVGPDGEPLAGGGAVTLVSRQAAQLLEGAGDGPLDIRLKRLVEDKESLVEQVKSLKIQLEETKQKSGKSDSDPTENGMDGIETQRDVTRQLSEHKFKLSKAEQDITALEQSIARLEGQVARYKTASENAEKVEDELKAEKRKLQRELRSAQDRVEELEITNSQLTKRLEKIKSTRNVVLPQE
ncbi:unnamed protein product [Lampetra planeri]